MKIKSVGLESEKLLLQIDAIASAYFKKLQLMPDEDRDLQEAKIQSLFKKVHQFSDVKVNLARATYEMVSLDNRGNSFGKDMPCCIDVTQRSSFW